MFSSSFKNYRVIIIRMRKQKLHLTKQFKFFEDCRLTKGSTRTALIDLGRNCYYLIPNDLHDILIKFDCKTINEILAYYNKTQQNLILGYFQFLLDKEIIFFTDYPYHFPKVSSTWKHPSIIYQAIIDIQDNNWRIDESTFKSLNNLNCNFLEIRLYGRTDSYKLKDFLLKTETTTIIGIDIYIQFISLKIVREIADLLKNTLRINNLFFYNSPNNEKIASIDKNSAFNIELLKQKIFNCLNCGVVSTNYFTINLSNYSKSINCNSCLHGKISIDSYGNIKNCPSMKENFGNIKDVKLERAVTRKDFKKYWAITKDQVKGCKDCEFRYMCTDCRAYLEDPKDIYSKPLKCGYNPYSGIWEKWSKNPLKNKAISFYNMQKIIES
jgi:SPASM domain peptide maturase of grasp-with-spasm system